MNINITGEFIHDAMRRLPYGDPRNDIGCTVIAQLSVALAYPTIPVPFPTPIIWHKDSFDPRNRIGRLVKNDERRTQRIAACRVGARHDLLTIE